MHIHLASEPAITHAIEAGDYELALEIMTFGVDRTCIAPEWTGKALYYPGLDLQMARLAGILGQPRPASPGGTMVIATELYQSGGHSRIALDILRESPSPILVLTDLFSSYNRRGESLDWVKEALPGITIAVLPRVNLWEKCRALHTLVREMNPQNVLFLQHHQDPIPFVATLNHSARKILVHHIDYQPSLGCTLEGIRHVDLHEEATENCAFHLNHPCQMLPLYAPDQGVIAQTNCPSVIMCADERKLAMPIFRDIVTTTLGVIHGRFYHAGVIPQGWVEEIQSVVGDRFVPMGRVKNLWTVIKTLDVFAAIGPAPIGANLTAIEYQGAGLGVIYYKPKAMSIANVESIYGYRNWGWSTLEELAEKVALAQDYQASSRHYARKFYLDYHSLAPFRAALHDILEGE